MPKITLEIEMENMQPLAAFLNSLTGAETKDEPESAPKADEKPKRTRRPAASKEKAAPAKEEKAEEVKTPQYTLEDVRKALKKYAEIEGKDAAVKILHDHGAKQMSALEPDQFESVLAETKIEESDPLD